MMMMIIIIMSHEIPDMVIIVCNLIKWLICTGANIDGREWLKVTASIGANLEMLSWIGI